VLALDNSRGVTAGPDAAAQNGIGLDPGESALDLVTDKKLYQIQAVWTNHGRILVRQSQPLPASVTAIIRDVEVGNV
jgi:hypothetical protein